MTCLAIIPARGGSKGLPGKNIKPLCGIPLIVHMIEHCRSATRIDRIIVSTDDKDIASIAEEAGAEVVMRPSDISGDTAPSEAALLHVLESLQEKEKDIPDITVFLQCTSPLITPEDIDASIEKLISAGADVVFTVTPFYGFLWRLDKSNLALSLNHDHRHRPMRQDLEASYLETGGIYAMRTSGFVRHKHRFFGKTIAHVLPAERSIDIDDELDFAIAEIRLIHRSSKGSHNRRCLRRCLRHDEAL